MKRPRLAWDPDGNCSADIENPCTHSSTTDREVRKVQTYLKETRRDGTPWHSIVRRNVSKDWTRGCSCTLRETKKGQTQIGPVSDLRRQPLHPSAQKQLAQDGSLVLRPRCECLCVKIMLIYIFTEYYIEAHVIKTGLEIRNYYSQRLLIHGQGGNPIQSSGSRFQLKQKETDVEKLLTL